MRQAVFSLSRMDATQADDPQKLVPHRARGYEKTKGKQLENAPFFDPSDRLPEAACLALPGSWRALPTL